VLSGLVSQKPKLKAKVKSKSRNTPLQPLDPPLVFHKLDEKYIARTNCVSLSLSKTTLFVLRPLFTKAAAFLEKTLKKINPQYSPYTVSIFSLGW